MLFALISPMAPAEAALANVGPVAENGYPSYYEDASGLRLRLCDDPADGCTMAAVPNPDAPVAWPTNYAGENFYFAAASADASYEAALEAAFTTEDATPGEQILFSRIRIRLTGLVAGATYKITHPYGVLNLTATATKTGAGEINYTDDQGCMAPPCGTFSSTLAGFVGDSSATTMNFLTKVGFNPASAAPGAEIGDPLTPTAVTGSPFDTNYFKVEGPNAGGPGIDVKTQSQFTIEGQVFGSVDPNRPSTPDLVALSDTGRVDTDNITSDTTPTFSGTAAAGAKVDLLVNGTVAGSATAAGGTYSVTPTAALGAGTPRIQTRTDNPAYIATRDPNNPAYIPASDPNNPAYDAAAYPNPPAYDVTTPATFTSGTLNMKIDVTAPTTTIGTPKPTNGTLDNTPTFSFTSAEAGSDLECKLVRGTEIVVDFEPCVSPLTYDAQPDGNYTFSVRSTDAAGNVGAPVSHIWRIGAAPAAPAAPTVTPASGTYTTARSVTMTAAAGTTIRYTVGNGTTVPADPTATTGSLYTGAIPVSTSQVIKAAAFNSDGVASPVVQRNYTINAAVAAPTVTPATGTYTTAQTVTMTAAAGTTIRYTVGNGTTIPADPTAASAAYTGPITVSASQVIKAAAFDTAGTRSPVVQRNYTINATPVAPAPPTVTPASGTYTAAQSVTMSAAAGTTIRYTVGNGTTVPANPTATTGTLYTGPVTVSSSQIIKAVAFNSANTASTMVRRNYTINTGTGTVLSTPTIGTAIAGVTTDTPISATAVWTQSTASGTPASFTVRAFRVTAAAPNGVLEKTVTGVASTASRRVVTGLVAGGQYKFTVQAIAATAANNSAESAKSNTVVAR